MQSADDILAMMRKAPSHGDLWRAIVIPNKNNIELLNPTLNRIRNLGIEHISVFCPSNLTVSQKYEYMLHRDNDVRKPLDVWKMALQTCGLTYTQSSTYFLVVEPGVYFWEQLLTYCESVIPQNEVAVWCPATPATIRADKPLSRPDCPPAFGWCPEHVSTELDYQHCFVLTGHMLTLLAAYLEPVEEGHVGSILARELGRRHVPYYFHTPAISSGSTATKIADNFVGVSYEMNQKEMKENDFILKNNKLKGKS